VESAPQVDDWGRVRRACALVTAVFGMTADVDELCDQVPWAAADVCVYPQTPRARVRKPMLYPLSYEGHEG
jgi:hypothetical protein